MKSKRTAVAFFGAALVLTGLSGWLVAGESDHDDGDRSDAAEILSVFEVMAGDLVPPATALTAATEKSSGNAIEIELSTKAGEGRTVVVWEIEFIEKGKIVKAFVDAHSGKVLGVGVDEDTAELKEAADLMKSKPVALDTILASLGKSVAGRTLKVALEEDDGAVTWEALLVHGGRLAEVEFQGATGKTLPEEDEGDDDHGRGDDDENEHIEDTDAD